MTGEAGTAVAPEALEKWVPRVQRSVGAEGLGFSRRIGILLHIHDSGIGRGELSGRQNAEGDAVKQVFHNRFPS
jgi:hypothetical protein